MSALIIGHGEEFGDSGNGDSYLFLNHLNNLWVREVYCGNTGVTLLSLFKYLGLYLTAACGKVEPI